MKQADSYPLGGFRLWRFPACHVVEGAGRESSPRYNDIKPCKVFSQGFLIYRIKTRSKIFGSNFDVFLSNVKFN